MCGWLPGGKSITQKRVPFGGGGVPTMRAPMSSIFSPTPMSAGFWSVIHISVERPFGALVVGRGRVDQHLGDVVGVVPGDDAPDRREVLPDAQFAMVLDPSIVYAAGRATFIMPLRSPLRKQRMLCSRIGMARSG